MLKPVILLMLLLALSGCTTTQYQSFNRGIGYQSEQTEESRYNVTYTASRTAKIEIVNDFALLRCAELTLEKGYDYFVITNAENYKPPSGGSGMVLIDDTALARNSGPPGMSGQIAAPNAWSKLTIVLLNEKPEGIHYVAKTVLEALKSEYEIPE